MGEATVQFKCHHCGHCCTEVVCLPTPYDVIRIVRATRIDPHKFLEFITPDEITGVRKSDRSWLKVGKEKYLMALRRDTKSCYFRDKRTSFCTIYEARPILCRLYPCKLLETRDHQFKGFRLHKDVGCPRHRDGELAIEPMRILAEENDNHLDDYFDLVEVFNRRQYDGKKPEDFIDMFVKVTWVKSSAGGKSAPKAAKSAPKHPAVPKTAKK
jgi:Fe-S-cluster containining protein